MFVRQKVVLMPREDRLAYWPLYGTVVEVMTYSLDR